jgi:serine phosphatase RsbU (regulator of sigma subunit)
MKISGYFLKLFFFYHFAISLASFASAQTFGSDSLKQLLKKHPEDDTVKANILISICKISTKQADYTKLLQHFAPQLLSLSNKLAFKKGIAYGFYYMSLSDLKTDYLKDEFYLKKSLKIMQGLRDKQGILLCFERLGRIKGEQNQYSEAIQFYSNAIELEKMLNDLQGLADCWSFIGRIYTHTGSYDKALECYIKALKIAESVSYKKKICETYISMGVIFFEQKKYNETIAYMNKAFVVEGNATNKQNLSYIYNNLAISYQYLDNHATSLSYHFKALKLNEEMRNDAGIAVSYNNISGVYASIGKSKEALRYVLKSIALSEKNNDKVGLTYSYIGAGDCYKGNKDFLTANNYYLKALRMAGEINYKTEEREAYEHLAIIAEEMNDYRKALAYHKKFSQIKDSILNEESLKQSTELNIRYETEKKEKEILLLTKDQELKTKSLKEQRLVRIGLIIGLGLLLTLSFLLFNRYRFKQKANLLLEKQKAEIRRKNMLITDSIDYAKNIQDAILPTPELLSALLPDHFIFYKPKDIVSGDFYWIFKMENKIICAVADCTGHGVPGAFMSLLGHNMLENIINKASLKPGEILTALNREIVARFSDNQEASKHGMDIAIISIDPTINQLEYAGARNSLYLIRKNELLEIKGDKLTLGTPSKDKAYNEYVNHTIPLYKDDMLYLFTDGFPDQKGGEEKKKFYYKPFKDLLISLSTLPLTEQNAYLDSTVTKWMGDGEQIDDILIVGIKY